jgi:hypothetical protein
MAYYGLDRHGIFANVILAGTACVCWLTAGGAAFAETGKASDIDRQSLQSVKNRLEQGKSISVTDAQSPLMRMLAASTQAMLAESKPYTEALNLTPIDKLIALEDITPRSPVLDHCDTFAALADRADEIGAHYSNYIAAAHRQGEIEVAANRLEAGEIEAFVDGMNDGRPRFEETWRTTGAFVRDAGALCTLLSHRRWRLNKAGQLEMTDPDELAQLQALAVRIQEDAQHYLELQKAAADTFDEETQKLVD